MKKIRVLVIDDSATIRRLIRARLLRDHRLEVVGDASDPIEAREKIKAFLPDVLTLDVEMPRMNGLEFLERLMRLRPMPVVMISTETHRGSTAAMEAFALGAFDCLGKPTVGMLDDAFDALPDLLVAAAGARLRPLDQRQNGSAPPAGYRWNGRIVLIGSSTGGVDALETVLSGYPAACPPTLIAQHMPAGFLASFAARLNARILPEIVLACDGEPLVQGRVYLAPGGETHLTLSPGTEPTCRLLIGEKRSGHRPSVDMMFESACQIANRTVAAILTGMGRDGAEQMLALRKGGARCLAQDEASSIVFGMPRVALELGGAERAVPLRDMAREILSLTGEATGSEGRSL